MMNSKNLTKTKSQYKELKEEIQIIQQVISWRKYKKEHCNDTTMSKYSVEDMVEFIKKKFSKIEIQNLWLDEVSNKNFSIFVNFCSSILK